MKGTVQSIYGIEILGDTDKVRISIKFDESHPELEDKEVLIHTEEGMDDIVSVICDKYCKYPYILQQEDLDKQCENCPTIGLFK